MQTDAIMKKRRFADYVRNCPPVLWVMIILLIFFSSSAQNYFSFNNIRNILIQASPLMILAFAQTLVILTEGIDLSLGYSVSLVTVMWIWLCQRGVSILLSAIIAVLVAVVIGACNGILVSKAKLPPFIATFGIGNIATSIALVLTSGSSIYYNIPAHRIIYETTILSLPLPIWIAAVLFIITWILLHKTSFGRNVFSLGGNPEALALAGVNTGRAYITTYAFAGLLCGLCGIITSCRVESGQPLVGNGWEFEAVAATILGGTSLREGKGDVTGTILGVFFIIIVKNGLNISGVSAMYQNVVIGIIVMVAIVFDILMRKRRDMR